MKKVLSILGLMIFQVIMLYGAVPEQLMSRFVSIGASRGEIEAMSQGSNGLSDGDWTRLANLNLSSEALTEFVDKAQERNNPKAALQFIENKYGRHVARQDERDDEQKQAQEAHQAKAPRVIVIDEPKQAQEAQRQEQLRLQREEAQRALAEQQRQAQIAAQEQQRARAEAERIAAEERARAERQRAQAERERLQRDDAQRAQAEQQRQAQIAAQEQQRARAEAERVDAAQRARAEQQRVQAERERVQREAEEKQHERVAQDRVRRDREERDRVLALELQERYQREADELRRAQKEAEANREIRAQAMQSWHCPDCSMRNILLENRCIACNALRPQELPQVQQQQRVQPPSTTTTVQQPEQPEVKVSKLETRTSGGEDEDLARALALSMETAPKETVKKKDDESGKEQKKSKLEKDEQNVDTELKTATDAAVRTFNALNRDFGTFVLSLNAIGSSGRFNYYINIFSTESPDYFSLRGKIRHSDQQNVDVDLLPKIIYLALFMNTKNEYDRQIRTKYDQACQVYTAIIYKLLLQKRACQNADDEVRRQKLDVWLRMVSEAYEGCIEPIAQFKAAMVKETFAGVKGWGNFSFQVDRADLTDEKQPLRGDQIFERMNSGETIISQIATMTDADFYIPAVTTPLNIRFTTISHGYKTFGPGIDAGGLRREFISMFLAPYFDAVEENKDEYGNDVISEWFFAHDKDLMYALPKDLSEIHKNAKLKLPEAKETEQARKKISDIDQEERELNEKKAAINSDTKKSANQKAAAIMQLMNPFGAKRMQRSAAQALLDRGTIKRKNEGLFDRYNMAFKALGRVLLLSLTNKLPALLPLPSSSFLPILRRTPDKSKQSSVELLTRLLYEYSPVLCNPFLDVLNAYNQALAEGKRPEEAADSLRNKALELSLGDEDTFPNASQWPTVLNTFMLKRLHLLDDDGERSRSLQALNEGLVIPDTIFGGDAERLFGDVESSETNLTHVAKFLVGDTKMPRTTLIADEGRSLSPDLMCIHLGRVWNWLSPEDCVYGLFASTIDAAEVKKGLDVRRVDSLNDNQKAAATLFVEAVKEYLDENTVLKDDTTDQKRKKQRALGNFVEFFCGSRAYDGRKLGLGFTADSSEYTRGFYHAHSCYSSADIYIVLIMRVLISKDGIETKKGKDAFKQAVKESIASEWKGGNYSHG